MTRIDETSRRQRLLRAEVEANRALVQADGRKIRTIVVIAALMWIPIIAILWMFR